jgi:hypothetical protein
MWDRSPKLEANYYLYVGQSVPCNCAFCKRTLFTLEDSHLRLISGKVEATVAYPIVKVKLVRHKKDPARRKILLTLLLNASYSGHILLS